MSAVVLSWFRGVVSEPIKSLGIAVPKQTYAQYECQTICLALFFVSIKHFFRDVKIVKMQSNRPIGIWAVRGLPSAPVSRAKR